MRFSKWQGAWLVSESQSRNHEPQRAVHAVHGRLRPEKPDLITLAISNCNLKRSQISRLLKEKNPDNISIARISEMR